MRRCTPHRMAEPRPGESVASICARGRDAASRGGRTAGVRDVSEETDERRSECCKWPPVATSSREHYRRKVERTNGAEQRAGEEASWTAEHRKGGAHVRDARETAALAFPAARRRCRIRASRLVRAFRDCPPRPASSSRNTPRAAQPTGPTERSPPSPDGVTEPGLAGSERHQPRPDPKSTAFV